MSSGTGLPPSPVREPSTSAHPTLGDLPDDEGGRGGCGCVSTYRRETEGGRPDIILSSRVPKYDAVDDPSLSLCSSPLLRLIPATPSVPRPRPKEAPPVPP